MEDLLEGSIEDDKILQIRSFVLGISDKVTDEIEGLSVEQVYEAILTLAAFAPGQVISEDELIDLIKQEITILKNLNTINPESENFYYSRYTNIHSQNVLIVDNSPNYLKFVQGTFDRAAFRFMTEDIIPELNLRDQLYDFLRWHTPILVRTLQANLQTGEVKDSDRVFIRNRLKNDLELLLESEDSDDE